MKYFDNEFADFFKELEENNNKKWFDENRKRYESHVKQPFKSFILDLVIELQQLYPNIDLSDKHSIMRINRDTRFGTDKTPYKVQMGAMIMPGGKGNKTLPGFYIQSSHKDVRVYSGVHMLEKQQLHAVRSYIKQNLKRFDQLIKEQRFENVFGEIQGDKHKRLPAEFKELENLQPLIANKDFYWFFKLPSGVLTEDNLIEQIISKYKTALPVNRFFEEALK